jgi:assimilatory nitrate reductase catalytic subunit
MDAAATPTHCPYCALQCGMMLMRSGEGVTVAARDFPTNKGSLCRKGWTAAQLLTAPSRLTSPLMREGKEAPLRPAGWDEALDRIASELRSIISRYGPDAAGIFGGGGLTNEKAYLLGKFARVGLGTSAIDYNGRFCMASAAAAGQRAFGIDRGLPFPLADIGGTEVIFLAGANPAETMPPIMQHFETQQRRGGQLIVADPRRTATAAAASVHLALSPGSDSALANGLLHIAIQDGLIDQDFIAARTNGFEAVRRTVASYWPDRVERQTGIAERQLRRVAHMLGEARTAMLLTARGTEQQSQGVNNVLAFINLFLALGHAGKKFCGIGSLTGQGNGQGGREHGQKADQLPGYRKLDDPVDRAAVAKVWGVTPESLPRPGRSACEMLNALGPEGGIRALIIMGSNPVVSAPDAGRVRDRLASLDLLVVADPFLSETAAMADIVLPVAQWAEEDGTMTNLEGRVLRRRRALLPPEGVRTDTEIIAALAVRLGRGCYFTHEPEDIFQEFRRATSGGTADYAGVSYGRIETPDGIYWPCPSEDHPGTPRLFLDRFATPDGLAKFHPIEHQPPAEEPDHDFPYYLTTGRILSQYQSGTQTRRVAELNEMNPAPFVEVHPDVARTLGLTDGHPVRLVTRRGEGEFRARFVASMRLDTLFVPFHWSGIGCVNNLTNQALDPISKIPEFKICAARLEAIIE